MKIKNPFDKNTCEEIGIKKLAIAKRDLVISLFLYGDHPRTYCKVSKNAIVGLLHDDADLLTANSEVRAFITDGFCFHLVYLSTEHLRFYKERK